VTNLHVLVEPGKPSKEVPCAVCGEMCLVHAYAATMWVKCPRHMKQKTKREKRATVLDPFELGISLEDRQHRIIGAIIVLKRRVDAVEWEETITATGIKSYDEETGVAELWAVGGSSTGMKDFDPRRECGQHVTVQREEMAAIR
jgi:hypothetical protein